MQLWWCNWKNKNMKICVQLPLTCLKYLDNRMNLVDLRMSEWQKRWANLNKINLPRNYLSNKHEFFYLNKKVAANMCVVVVMIEWERILWKKSACGRFAMSGLNSACVAVAKREIKTEFLFKMHDKVHKAAQNIQLRLLHTRIIKKCKAQKFSRGYWRRCE